MSVNRFNINYRIFKRERVREGDNSLVIVPKNKQVVNKNQIEFVWINKELKAEHLSILGRVVVKEWERLLPKTAVCRAFIQQKKNDSVRFYISFQVDNDLDGVEIKKLISSGLGILNDCLEKVTKKVIGVDRFNESYTLSKEISLKNEEVVKDSLFDTDDELINRLNEEIEQQEKLLQHLAEQQLQSPIRQTSAYVAPIVEPVEEPASPRLSDQELSLLYGQIDSLEREVSILTLRLQDSNELSQEFDKVTTQLSQALEENQATTKRLEEAELLELKIEKIEKENSDYRIQCMDSQTLIDEYSSKSNQLKENIEQLELSKKEVTDKAKIDYMIVEDLLRETDKKLILETNERQKLEMSLENTRKKLVESDLKNQGKDQQIKGLLVDLADENKTNEKRRAEIDQLIIEREALESELQMTKTTNQVLKGKLTEHEVKIEKLQEFDMLQEKYETLQARYMELEQDGYNYKQEISLLNTQLQTLEEDLENIEPTTPVAIELDDVLKYEPKLEKLEANVSVYSDGLDSDYDYEYDYTYDSEYDEFSYESDPFVEEVVSEELLNIRRKDQVKEEEKIMGLLDAYQEDSYRDVKVDRAEYRQYMLDFKFLNFRWNQVFIMDEVDKSSEFLESCTPYIDIIEEFEEELEMDVKKSFFLKNYVTINESTLKVLKGYSKLSTYLDTYYLKLSFYIDKYFLNEGNRK